MYYNRKRVKGLTLLKGDLVYLLRKNIKTKRLSNKLDFTRLGLFKIKREIKDISIELELLRTIKIYLVFYVLLLEKAPKNTKLV